MTLPRLAALTAYWKKHPPTHVTSAIIAGWKVPEDADDVPEVAAPQHTDLPEYEEGVEP